MNEINLLLLIADDLLRFIFFFNCLAPRILTFVHFCNPGFHNYFLLSNVTPYVINDPTADKD